jgi:hypothetical protein
MVALCIAFDSLVWMWKRYWWKPPGADLTNVAGHVAVALRRGDAVRTDAGLADQR